jgi:hypothetical protein
MPTILAALTFLSACAGNPTQAESLSADQSAQVHHACAQTMGLEPSEADYSMCTRSLRQTLAGLEQAKLVEQDRRVCMSKSFQPGTREFALCVVNIGHRQSTN